MTAVDMFEVTWTLAPCTECDEPLTVVDGKLVAPMTLHMNEQRQQLVRPHARTCAVLLAGIIAQTVGRGQRAEDVAAARAVVEFVRGPLISMGREAAALVIDDHADEETERTEWDGSPGALGNWINGIRDGARRLRGETPHTPEETP